MTDRTEKTLLEALLLDGGATQAEIVTKPKRERKPKKLTTVDFADIEGKLTFQDKLPEKWNKVDLRHYFDHLYKEMFGQRTQYTIPFFYQKTNEVFGSIARVLGIDTMPPPLMKEFYDWYFEFHIHKVVSKFNFFKLEWMGKEWIVNAFVATQTASASDPISPEEPLELPDEEISVDDIKAQAAVSFQSVLTTFGLVIAANWVSVSKNAPIEKAVVAVQRAAVAAVKSDRRYWVNIVSATEKYGPYPSWLPWKDADTITDAVQAAVGGELKRIVVESSDDSKSYGFLRNK